MSQGASEGEQALTVAVTGPTGTFGFGLIPLLQADERIARIMPLEQGKAVHVDVIGQGMRINVYQQLAVRPRRVRPDDRGSNSTEHMPTRVDRGVFANPRGGPWSLADEPRQLRHAYTVRDSIC